MKRILKIIIMLFIVISFSMSTHKVEADASYVSYIPVQIVEDIDNCPYPETYIINYKNSEDNCSQFTIDSPGQFEAIFNSQVSTNNSGNIWISTDRLGMNIIGDVFKFNNTDKKVSWFLEKGTYYLNSTWTDIFSQVNIALLFEKSKAVDTERGNNFQSSYKINQNSMIRGFLSNAVPNEYYTFDLTQKTAVTFKYNFDTSVGSLGEVGTCALYDHNQIFLTEGIYSKTKGGVRSFTYQLEKGTYYVKLSGILGNTTLSLSPMYYDIKLTADTDGAWTVKPIDVRIKTSIDFSAITVLCKNIDPSLINNDTIWSKASEYSVPCDGLTFKAKKSGIYSVRITDINGVNTMEKIKISNIDATKPTIKGVKNGKAYRKPVKITWTDKQSGVNLNKTTLNGQKVSNGITVSKEGKYTLYIYDVRGNYVKTVFYIDYTSPTTVGVKNGMTYSDTVSVQLKDNLSGIKKITIDDIEQPSSFTNLYLYENGKYTIKLWDNAGNYKKVVFKINKQY